MELESCMRDDQDMCVHVFTNVCNAFQIHITYLSVYHGEFDPRIPDSFTVKSSSHVDMESVVSLVMGRN